MNIRKHIFYEEVRRAFSIKRFALVIFLSAAVFMVGYWSIEWVPKERSWIDLWYSLYNQSYFHQILPLIAALPFADSLATDRMQGYFNQLLARANYKKVIWAKVAANALAGGVSASLPMILLYGVTRILLPVTTHPLNAPIIDQYAVRPYDGFLRMIFMQNPHWFVIIVISLVFLVGAIYATFGLSSSFLVNNRFFAFGLPFVFFIFCQYFSDRTRLLGWYWSPVNTLLSYPFGKLILQPNEIPLLFVNPLIVLTISLGIYMLFGQRQRVLESHNVTQEWINNLRVRLMLPFQSKRSLNKNISQTMGTKKTKPLFNYFKLQMRMNLFRWQWLLVIPVIAIMAIIISKFMLSNQVASLSFYDFSDVENAMAPVNVWDVFFVIFGNPYTMSFVLVNLFLVLVSDLQPETGYGQQALFRLRSRFQSWMAKIAVLFSLACIYVVGSLLLIVLVSAIWFPIEWEWSQLALMYTEGINLPPLLTRQLGLFQGVGLVVSLVIVGFFCLGLLVMLINSLTHRRIIGYLLVESLVLSSIGLSSMLVNGPDWQMVLPVIRNLVLVMVPFRARGYPIWLSFAHWLVWLLILTPMIVKKMRHQDYLSNAMS